MPGAFEVNQVEYHALTALLGRTSKGFTVRMGVSLVIVEACVPFGVLSEHASSFENVCAFWRIETEKEIPVSKE